MSLTGDAAKALDAFKSGKDVMEAVGGSGAQTDPSDVVFNADGDETSPLLTELEDQNKGLLTQEKAPPGEKSEAPKSDRKRLAVDKGKNHIDVDYSDRKAIDNAFLQAHGMRKFQLERDQANKQLKALREEHTPLKDNWSRLEKAWQEGGVSALVDLLEGQSGAYKAHIAKEMERAEFLRKATPDQRAALEELDKRTVAERETAKLRQENEEFRKRVESDREAAEMRSLESRIHPSFERHRFAGKLGNTDDEHLFDSALWQLSLKRLEPYEDQGLDITPELVEREFRSVAATLRKRINVQAEKVASKAVEKQKQAATENAQAKAMSGFRGNKLGEEAAEKIRGGDLTGLLKNWGKFGSVFNR